MRKPFPSPLPFAALAFAFGILRAQQPVAPTDESVGAPRGVDAGDYNITNSFETGYRFAIIGGNEGLYRSDVNYGNGVRLLASNLTVDSKYGHGKFFDEILLTTLGLGNDPYQAVTLRIRKNRFYRYDMTWRQDDFYNPGVVISGGGHFLDTTRRLQDHDLTLLPDSHFQVELGYSRNTQSGPGLSTVQEFDTNSAAFPVFENVRRQWNEYRVGLTAEIAGFKLIVRHNWDFFKDDTGYNYSGSELPTVPGDPTTLQSFLRSEPYHGRNPSWLGNLFTNRKRWAVNARLSYAGANGQFDMDEYATGLDRFGAAANRDILVSGNAQRPVVAGDLTIDWMPTDRLTVVNHTSVHNTRIDGDSFYTEYDYGTGTGTTLNFDFLGVRTIANETDIHYRLMPWLAVYTGYTFSDRQIRLQEAFNFFDVPGLVGSSLYVQYSHLNAARLGFELHPVKPLTVNLEGEAGHDDDALTPISQRNFHTLNGRAQYRSGKLQLSAAYREQINENAPLSFNSYSSRSRQTSASGSWSFNNWFSLDASYTKLHLDTVGSLAFFAGVDFSQLQTGYDSIYISNIHAGNLMAHFSVARRADIYVGYSITKDTGDGRQTATGTANPADPVGSLLASVQTFPLTFQSPMARVSVRISPKLRWNAGWQYYGYAEQFQLFSYYENYHAHTGYTSLLWSF